jgi:GTP cyclohydrolase II
LILLRKFAEARLLTRWADFRMLAFEGRSIAADARRPVETAIALVLGDIHTGCPLVRIHSQCATGDVFHSLRCDCHDQLHLALERIAGDGAGILIYEHQEGRGIGLIEKLRAYQLQDAGLDTIEANLHLGHNVDLRDYLLPVQILRHLGVSSLRLMTNNPDKLRAILSSGIQVLERVSAEVFVSPHAARYAATKRDKMGHFDSPAAPPPASRHLGCQGGAADLTQGAQHNR